MPTVVGIKFKPAGKTYFFEPNELLLKPGDEVIVETARGLEYAFVSEGQRSIEKNQFNLELRPVLRLANDSDRAIYEENLEKSKEALPICQQIVDEHELGMNLISADYNFDCSQLLFIYTAKERVDFRNLLKHLAATFRTRIELRQIGDRDEPKLVGGIGICGRNLCCQQFLKEFSPISIKMAKEQNLSLNTAKISGFCGKLLCCLAYENEHYEERNRLKREAEARGEVFECDLCRKKAKEESPLLEKEAPAIEEKSEKTEVLHLKKPKKPSKPQREVEPQIEIIEYAAEETLVKEEKKAFKKGFKKPYTQKKQGQKPFKKKFHQKGDGFVKKGERHHDGTRVD